VEREADLDRLMTTEAGALDGYSAARQDLWRLAHLILSARGKAPRIAGLPSTAAAADDPKKSARAMRRTLRRSLVAYSRALQGREKEDKPMIVRGRAAALTALGTLDSHQGIPATTLRLLRGVKQDWEGGRSADAPYRLPAS